MTSMDDPALPPDPTRMRIGDGPMGVLAALATGDPARIAQAQAAQREWFKQVHGCHLEDAVEVCPECTDEHCPIWLPMRADLRAERSAEGAPMTVRLRLREEHDVREVPCCACGGGDCDIFMCYGGS
jgi:hypothetical protein